MIALKTNQQMSAEMLSFDSALLSPTEQSFFNEDVPQTQHCSEITDEWLQDFDDIRRFCDGLELGLNYEPELSLEAMTKEVGAQYQPKAEDIIDYLDSTAFLSPESIEPSSPPQYAEHETGLDSETAISLLEEMLVANAEGSSGSQQYYDELTIPLASEDSSDSSMTCDSPPSPPVIETRPKRQLKRKAQEVEPIAKPKPKRGKASVETKRERKRKQNKFAANRYRQKKRAEMDGMEEQHQTFEDVNTQLKAQLQKLQMEFKVVYPLAKAAFASDPNRSLQLQMLDIRVLNEELLD